MSDLDDLQFTLTCLIEDSERIRHLEQSGYIKIELQSLASNENAIDMREWLIENCPAGGYMFGRVVMIKDPKEAAWFKLRWV